MSSRAIQRLREQKASIVPDTTIGEDSNHEEDDDDDNGKKYPAGGAFAAMMGDGSDESSSDDDESDDGHKKNDSEHECMAFRDATKSSDKSNYDEVNDGSIDDEEKKPAHDSKVMGQPKEDIDALLEEFKLQDDDEQNMDTRQDGSSSSRSIITSGMDIRDLDIDYVMRTALLGSGTVGESSTRSNRSRAQTFLFGNPSQDWVRPPRHVGGGIGMVTYDNYEFDASTSNANTSTVLPWPYSGTTEDGSQDGDLSRWFTFIHSDTYEKDCDVYEQIKASGDPNALALFVAHHPFLTEALLQLSTVLYQFNQSQEGLAFLRRALWIYECSALPSFTKIQDWKSCFMDYQRPENYFFFLALFRLVRISCVAGLPRVSLAVSRYILSLDPQRDPMGLLLAIDHFALSTNEEAHTAWLIDFVESNKVRIRFVDRDNGEEYICDLLSLPNWAFSYALALHRTNESMPSMELKQKAKDAIQVAMSTFPSVIEELLKANEVDLVGRSFQTDWPSALEYTRRRSKDASHSWTEPTVTSETVQAYELIVKIFVQQNAKLWKSQDAQRWVCESLMELKSTADSSTDTVPPLSTAIRRYGLSDLSDYEDKFQTMPPEANPLDPGLIPHALAVDPNRRRLFQQRMPRGEQFELENDMDGQPHAAIFAGPPTQAIDPDWPILEVLWRSALPWNYVDGVPPPRR